MVEAWSWCEDVWLGSGDGHSVRLGHDHQCARRTVVLIGLARTDPVLQSWERNRLKGNAHRGLGTSSWDQLENTYHSTDER